jgi:hypothetical protein
MLCAFAVGNNEQSAYQRTYRLTSADQIVSQMNRLAARLLVEFRAVEIQASLEAAALQPF